MLVRGVIAAPVAACDRIVQASAHMGRRMVLAPFIIDHHLHTHRAPGRDLAIAHGSEFARL